MCYFLSTPNALPSRGSFTVGINEKVAMPGLAKIIDRHLPHTKIDPELGDECWPRDSQVVGLNRMQLIPYSPLTDFLDENFWALLPQDSYHFIKKVEKGFSDGLENASISLSNSQARHLPYRKIRSSIEGGNCYVFFDSEEQRKAIVGIHSIVLSMIALEEQGYFLKHQEEIAHLIAGVTSPSDDAILRARNTEVFNATVSAARNNRRSVDYFEYGDALTQPLTDEDRAKYFQEALIWEAKEKLTRQVIAEDLHVPFENVAFVPQREFHIDMEMFVAPNGDVYVDQNSVIAAKEEIERMGSRVIPVHGNHQVGNKTLNFMNGVFVSTPLGPLFVTNGVDSNDEKSLKFCAEFAEEISRLSEQSFKVDFVENMDEVVTFQKGGIHCLSRETPLHETPLDLILNFFEEEIPREKIRECVENILFPLNNPFVVKVAILGQQSTAQESLMGG